MSVTEEEFKAKIIEVRDNLYCSHFHLKIHEKMTDEINARLGEYPPFIDWSRVANYKAGVLGLTIAYDKNSLGLLKIIDILQSNHSSWNLPNSLDYNKLAEDRNFVSPKTNPLVESLIHLRDKVISHTDSRLYPRMLSPKLQAKLQAKYGEGLTLQKGEVSQYKPESPLANKSQQGSNQESFDIFEELDKEKTQILGKRVPSFEQFYVLTTKGIEICNKYSPVVGLLPIELALEGID